MIATQYAQALHRSLLGKTKAEQTKIADTFLAYIHARRHQQLLPRIVKRFKTIIERTKQNKTVLYVAKEEDIRNAKKESSFTHDGEIIIDEKIIGGWQLEEGSKLTDASYKRSLVELYRNITT